MLFSAFPLYWMFVIATSTDEAVSQIPPSVIPGGELLNNLQRGLHPAGRLLHRVADQQLHRVDA